MLGARRLTRLMILRALTSSISDNCALVRFDVRRRRWLLPPLVRTTLPEPVRRKRLDVALWVLSLVFVAFALRGIVVLTLLSDKIKRGSSCRPADFDISGTCSRIGLAVPLWARPLVARPFPSFSRRLCWVPAPQASCGLPFAARLRSPKHRRGPGRSLSDLRARSQDNPSRG